ncbi:MAG TPA: alpha-ketoglutarate-dependent dioxygenase AlkB [Vicinamibacterales bacterium]|nr:alpha-ketoglutarate-dependent dioxygenase AlkB [Vicinamibacterales bacterium]
MNAVIQIEPGLFFFQRRLTAERQGDLWRRCRALADGAVPMYVPTVRGGRKMSVGMLCLGRHWNPQTYRYEAQRSDHDGLAVPDLPQDFVELAMAAAADAGFGMTPDLCIMNFYDAESRMGVHQDKDESPESIAAGAPIVSVSLGDTARFVVGGLTRKETPRPLLLRSGDVLVMGGPSRLRFHGVTRILTGTAPAGTGPGRFNLTFRQW